MDTSAITAPQNPARNAEAPPRDTSTDRPFFGDNGFGFDDILDAINPLQHIPLVNAIYRRLTGDELSMGSRLAGGALFGGAIGFAASLVNAVIEDTTGNDVGGHVVALFWPEQDAAPSPNGYAALPSPQEETTIAVAVPEQTLETAQEATLALPASPIFLAAMPTRTDVLAAQETLVTQAAVQAPSRGAAGNVPTLSPAAMEALLLSVGLTGAFDDEESDDEGLGQNASRAAPRNPAAFAAWQAATAEQQPTQH